MLVAAVITSGLGFLAVTVEILAPRLAAAI
jgi:hypothetical protein